MFQDRNTNSDATLHQPHNGYMRLMTCAYGELTQHVHNRYTTHSFKIPEIIFRLTLRSFDQHLVSGLRKGGGPREQWLPTSLGNK